MVLIVGAATRLRSDDVKKDQAIYRGARSEHGLPV
jgi:hypothetical protein